MHLQHSIHAASHTRLKALVQLAEARIL